MGAVVDWSNLTHASAFVLGAVLATIATLRIVRVVFGVRREESHKDDAGVVRVDVIAMLEIAVLVLLAVYLADRIWNIAGTG